MRKILMSLLIALASLAATGSAFAAFDHEHRAWTELLKKHVVLQDSGKASQVRYAGFAKDRGDPKAYLDPIRDQKAPIKFLDYNWGLNDARS